MKKFQKSSRAYFPRVAISIRDKNNIKSALKACLNKLGENQVIDLFLPKGINQMYIPPETTQKLNLYSLDFKKAQSHKLINKVLVKKVNVLYKEPSSEKEVELDEAATNE